MRDYADVNGDGMIDMRISQEALELLEVDSLGLDPADRMLLNAIIDSYDGGPVGVETLAALTAEERSTIEDEASKNMSIIGRAQRTAPQACASS